MIGVSPADEACYDGNHCLGANPPSVAPRLHGGVGSALDKARLPTRFKLGQVGERRRAISLGSHGSLTFGVA
jgi:hypothetical protein